MDDGGTRHVKKGSVVVFGALDGIPPEVRNGAFRASLLAHPTAHITRPASDFTASRAPTPVDVEKKPTRSPVRAMYINLFWRLWVLTGFTALTALPEHRVNHDEHFLTAFRLRIYAISSA